MKEFFDKVITWIKENMVLAILIFLAAVVVFFGKKVRRVLFGSPRRRVRHRRRIIPIGRRVRRRGPLPRSVGVRGRGRGYPAAGGGTIPYKYNKDGTVKKAWQVGGTVAAKSRMSRLRRAK
jgi:hypothetical protein